MRYVAAYLLARLGGNDNPDASDIKKILESVGAEVDEGKLQHVVSELRGKDIDEVWTHLLTSTSVELKTCVCGVSDNNSIRVKFPMSHGAIVDSGT